MRPHPQLPACANAAGKSVQIARFPARVALSPKVGIALFVTLYVGLSLWALKSALSTNSIAASIVAFAIPLVPFGFAASLRAPLIFPFCVYAAVIPFENLVAFGVLGSLPRILAVVATGAIVARIVITKRMRLPGRTVVLWGVVMLFMAASVMWANDRQEAFSWFSRYVQQYMLLVVVAMVPARPKDLRAVMIGLVAGGICAALYGDYLLAGNATAYRHDRLVVEAGDRQVDPNEFAAALILPFGLAMMYFLRLRFGLRKLLAFGMVAILVGGFVASGSRGGLIAIGVLLAYLLWFSPYRLQLGLFIASGSVAILASPLVGRFAVAVSSGGAGRTSIWKTGYVAFRKNWLVGVGIGNFQDAYDRAWFQVYHGTYKHWHMVAHNLIAQTAVELGIVGLAILLYAWYVQLRNLRACPAPGPLADIRAAIEASTVGLFVASLFVGIMHQKAVWSVFLLSAIALSCARSLSPAADEASPIPPAPPLSLGEFRAL